MQKHMSYLQKHPSITRSRLSNFIGNNQWNDVNIQSVLYDQRISGEPHVMLEVWSAPGQERPTFGHAVKQEFSPAKVGQVFGPSWTTHWFRVTVNIPKEFAGKKVQFLFDTNSEAMVWSADGEPIMGLTGGNGGERHVDYTLTAQASEHEKQRVFYMEMACNDLFGNGDYHEHPQDRAIYYQLSSADLVAPNEGAWALYHDLEVIVEMASRLSQDSPRSWQALTAANAIVNVFDHADLSSIEPARELARQFFKAQGSEANHQVYAIGNCHIDTAWLWPYAETKRKAARSWSTQLQLMESYPEYRFAASQAQQFEWLKENYSSLFAKIQDKAKTGQFIPIGSTWVEMDCNLPSGESLARQFLLGQQFYKEHFGEISDVFWLPDTFGYSSQLPQIVRLSGAKYFFTQKLSWNNINKFPNTTFRWIGLDGSHVLTHMAPSETYGAQCRPGELIDSVKKHKDIAYTNESLYLFGNGDGGGGPLRAMLERLRRMENVDGLPRVKQAHPREFYEHVERTATDLVAWKGELYFELHRGTYTSQSNNKLWNRQSEFILREVELLSTVAHMHGKHQYPANELTRLWKLVCLNQFHDVIPGSSINVVYRDSDKIYEDVFASAKKLRQDALAGIYGGASEAGDAVVGFAVLNTTGWMRSSVVAVPAALAPQFAGAKAGDAVHTQVSKDGAEVLVLASNIPGCSAQVIQAPSLLQAEQVAAPGLVPAQVRASQSGDGSFVLENRQVRVTVDRNGRVTSYYDRLEERELVAAGQAGNVLELYDDVPLYWDAWDVEIYALEKYRALEGGEVAIGEEGPLVASLYLSMDIGPGGSKLRQKISLSAESPRLDFENDLDWHESRKWLRTSFTWDIYSDQATYETQYGVVQRPTHRNTTWDMAKFEVCGHKFADLSEFGYGVALLNNSKYGYATVGNTMSLSLMRAPKAPDEHCDMGRHRFQYAIYPHAGTFSESNVVQEAYQFNVPLQVIPLGLTACSADSLAQPCFSVSGARNVVLDCVKMAEDGSDSYVVRLYEAYGGHARALVTTKLPAARAHKVDILEERMGEDSELAWVARSRTVEVAFKPFEVVTLKYFAR